MHDIVLQCTHQGAQGALWPFLLNVVSCTFVGFVLYARFLDPRFMETAFALQIAAVNIVTYLLQWFFLALAWYSNPGFIDPAQVRVLSNG
jgi:hypothetical protein